MRWYADNSELYGVRDANIPDILLFGGIVVPAETERAFQNAIEATKERFCPARAPIKWNFKDLKKFYERRKRGDLYRRMLDNSKEIRAAIFEEAVRHDFQIVISCIESHSVVRDVIKNKKGRSFRVRVLKWADAVRPMCSRLQAKADECPGGT